MFLVKTEHDLIGDIVDPFVQGLLPCGAQVWRAAQATWHRVRHFAGAELFLTIGISPSL